MPDLVISRYVRCRIENVIQVLLYRLYQLFINGDYIDNLARCGDKVGEEHTSLIMINETRVEIQIIAIFEDYSYS